MGPKLVADKEVVSWGAIHCLRDYQQSITLHNVSLISAPFKAFVRSSKSKFRVNISEGVLGPDEKITLELTAHLDDTVGHKDKLHVLVGEGDPLEIQLKAKGIGTTMHCDNDLSVIDFGPAFTNITCERQFLLENKGRRPQTLSWVNATCRERDMEQKRAMLKKKSGGGGGGDGGKFVPSVPVFTVEPDSVELKPRTACLFTFKGNKAEVGAAMEKLECYAKVGSDRTSAPVFSSEVKADFIDPLLEPSTPRVSFTYTHANDEEPLPITQILTLTNVSSLPLDFTLKCPAPFRINQNDFHLETKEEATVEVTFFPGYKGDRQSHVVEKAITAVYANHPRRDAFPLVGNINFPNISMEYEKIDFGCILNDTTRSVMVRVTNTSVLPAKCAWSFVSDEDEESKRPANDIPVNQVFDILPIRFNLEPGESEMVEFVYYGHANRSFDAIAVCEVEGGPEYEATLHGEASTLGYRLDRQFLDFGAIFWDRTQEKEFFLQNTGKVPYAWNIRTDLVSRPDILSIHPPAGKVFAGDSQRIVVRFRPGLPTKISEKVIIEVAHFEPVEFPIYGEGTFATVDVAMPRYEEEDAWAELLQEAEQSLRSSTLQSPTNGFELEPEKPLSKKAVEAEALRLRFLHHLEQFLPESVAPKPSTYSCSDDDVIYVDVEGSDLDVQLGGATSARGPPTQRSQQRTARKKAASSKALVKPKSGEDFVLARHLVDFGNVVAGANKSRVVRIVNTTSQPVTFDVNKSDAAALGFIVEPFKVTRLPEGEAVEIKVTFRGKRKELGLKEVEVPFEIKNGPQIALWLRTNVTIPDISIEPSTLDFGTTRVGFEKHMYFRVTNLAPVPSEWSLGTIVGAPSKIRDKDFFTMDPPGGVLPGHGIQIVRVSFMPSEVRKYAIGFPLKVDGNSAKAYQLQLRGRADDIDLVFDPPQVSLGPIKPSAAPEERIVTITNPTAYDLELYSVDFDSTWETEAKILAASPAFEGETTLLVPPRAPGEGLPEAIMKPERERAEREAKLQQLERLREAAEADGVEFDEENAKRELGLIEEEGVGELEHAGETLADTRSPRMEGRAVNVVVLGPPTAGVSVVAEVVARRYNCARLTLDDIVEWARSGDSELADEVRAALAASTEALNTARSQKKSARGKGKGKKEEPEGPKDPQITEGLLERCISQRVRYSDCSTAVVIDGLSCKSLVDGAAAFRAIKSALGSDNAGVFKVIELKHTLASVAKHMEALLRDLPAVAEGETEDIPWLHAHRFRPENEAEGASEEEPVQDDAAAAPVSASSELSEVKEGDEEEEEKSDVGQEENADADSPQPVDGELQRQMVVHATSLLEKLKALGVSKEVLAPILEDKGEVPHWWQRWEATHNAVLNALNPVAPEPELDADGQPIQVVDTDRDEHNDGEAKDTDADTSDKGSSGALLGIDTASDFNAVFDVAMHVLPEKPEPSVQDPNAIPEPEVHMVLARPSFIPTRSPPTRFRILRTDVAMPTEPTEEEEPPMSARSKGKSPRGGKKGKGKEETEPVAQKANEALAAAEKAAMENMRWVLPAGQTVSIRVRFNSATTGRFHNDLAFDVVGSHKQWRLPVSGVCAVPEISSDPRNVFMQRVKHAPDIASVKCRFVGSRNRFEFGPLVAGLPYVENLQSDASSNCTKLRITNNGMFPCNVSFMFGRSPGKEAVTLRDGAVPPSEAVFHVSPATLNLPVGETEEVWVSAFPPIVGEFENTLLALVDDNPIPAEFTVAALGAEPGLAITGPWKQPEVVESKSPRDKKKGGKSPRPDTSIPELAFERLLIGGVEEKRVELKNTSPVPVAWHLLPSGLESAPRLHVAPTSGTIGPGESEYVVVSFAAEEEEVVRAHLQIEYSDTSKGSGAAAAAAPPPEDPKAKGGKGAKPPASPRARMVEFVTTAEGYRIKPFIKFDDKEEGVEQGKLDFGLQRCFDRCVRKFTVANQGKYAIGFRAALKRPTLGDVVTITPPSGVLQPGSDQVIEVAWRAEREVTVTSAKDLTVSILEETTGQITERFDVALSGQAVFSKFRIMPSAGINFGAMRYDESRERKVEIQNDGLFPFEFTFVEPGSEEDKAMSMPNTGRDSVEESKKGGKGKAPPPPKGGKGGKGAPAGGSKEFGPFVFEPGTGTIQPNERATITVRLQPTDPAVLRKHIRVCVTGVDPRISRDEYLYEVQGESCTPSIDLDWEEVFEEQAVVPQLDPTSDESRVFAVQSRTFNFGHIIPMSAPRGVVERFKIGNTNKIKARIAFNIGSAADSEGVFAVQPASIDIPPHEHRYIDVYFKPHAMKQYKATFEGVVEGAKDPEAAKLRFDLAGEGTLPCITVVNPTERDHDGKGLLNLGRIRLGEEANGWITLRNDALVPATAKFAVGNMKGKGWQFGAAGTSLTLEAGQEKKVNVLFKALELPPKGSDTKEAEAPKGKPAKGKGGKDAKAGGDAEQPKGAWEIDIVMDVMNNQFEHEVIKVVADTYQEDILFVGLPGNNTMDFGNTDMSESSKRVITLQADNTSASWLRCVFSPDTAGLSFSPSMLHIPPKGSVPVVATWAPPEPTALTKVSVPVTAQRIKFEQPPQEPWNNAMKAVEFSEEKKEEAESKAPPAPAKGKKAPAGKDKNAKAAAPDDGSVPEPAYEAAADPAAVTLRAVGAVDHARAELSPAQVVFKPTMMYQARSTQVVLKNPSKTTLNFDWDLSNLQSGVIGSARSGGTTPQLIPHAPFTITPSKGTVAAGEEVALTVRFAPQDVADYRVEALPGLSPSSDATASLKLSLTGRSQRPVCHFDLPPSDYLERRPQGMPGPTGTAGPLPPGIRVIEFKSLGTRIRNTFRFYAINPTGTSYQFVWEPIGNANPAFKCTTARGTIMSGRKYEMVFEYTPSDIARVEGFYRFSIPSASISQLVLLTGVVVEPRVTLEPPHVNFKQLIVKGRASETIKLVNKEHIPFQFSFDTSLVSTPGAAMQPLVLTPDSGVVPPNGETEVEVRFSPQDERRYNFNVPCIVKNKPAKLSLNIKGEGYAVHDHVTIADPVVPGQGAGAGAGGSSGTGGTSVRPGVPAVIDFQNVYVNERSVRDVTVANTGRVNFEFQWKAPPRTSGVTVTPLSGKVSRNESMKCQVEFKPLKEGALENCKLECIVAGTRSYIIDVVGTGAHPAVDFSSTDFHFGPVFTPLVPGGEPFVETASLLLTNNEQESDVSIECMFEKKPHLEVDFAPTILRTRESIEVPIRFSPRHVTPYREVIPFVINGLFHVHVQVTGEGIPILVDLANPAHAQLNFGVVLAGSMNQRQVTLVNRSRKEVSFTLEEDAAVDGTGRLEAAGVHFDPLSLTLRSQEATRINISFAPLQRLPAFSEPIYLRLGNDRLRLMEVSGVAQGMDVKLSTDAVTFGAVCEGSQMKKSLSIINVGDLATSFEFDPRELGSNFSIKPSQGFLAPHSEAKVDVVFHPVRVEKDIKLEAVRCYLEDAAPVVFSIAGSCVPQPAEDVENLSFECKVRAKTVKEITLPKNTTTTSQLLQPVIQSDNWVGPPSVEIPAGAGATYPITYRPLTMATSEAPHQGSVFFPLPDGRGLLYRLSGVAHPPDIAQVIEQTTPAKTQLSFVIPVENWLNTTQRFTVSWPDVPAGVTLKGAVGFDVPALATRDYKMTFSAIREGVTEVTVTFKNEISGEYVPYRVKITATPAKVLSVIPLEAAVRQEVTTVITVDNPFEADTKITFEEPVINHPCVQCKMVKNPSGASEGAFQVAYRPLIPNTGGGGGGGGGGGPETASEASLTLRSPQLGDFLYTLKLMAIEPLPENALRFKATLGETQTQKFRFKHYLKAPADYTCKTSQPLFFQAPATVKVGAAASWDGENASVDVVFEPEKLGEIRDELIVHHASGGRFVVPLYGVCVPPRPRGPIAVAPGGSVSVPFKNVFNAQTEFSVSCDNPAFAVGSATLSLPAKKDGTIAVKYTPSPDQPKTAKLVVTSSAAKATPWVFYLEAGKEAAGKGK